MIDEGVEMRERDAGRGGGGRQREREAGTEREREIVNYIYTHGGNTSESGLQSRKHL